MPELPCAGTPRALWRCERCNAYHVGGLDMQDEGDDIVAMCGARWKENEPNDDLSEVGTAFVPVEDAAEDAVASDHLGRQEASPRLQLTTVLRDELEVRLVNLLATSLGVSRDEVVRRAVLAYAAQERAAVQRALHEVSPGLPLGCSAGSTTSTD